MAYDISTYKTALDNYLTSGVKYIRYIRKSINNATIYYPIIDDAQIKSFLNSQIFKEGKGTYYKNSKPYSDWDWITSNYEIVGLQELNSNTTADYFVLIVGNHAALIELTSENYETERISHDSKVYDIQTYFLLKASKRITRSGSYFYRYAYNHGRFIYDQKRLPFEQMVKIAQDRLYTSDRMFIEYLPNVSVNETDNLLNILLGRYIRGCKGVDSTISKKDWLSHTKHMFDDMSFTNTNLEQIRERILRFCEQQSGISSVADNSITAHFTAINGKIDLEKLYQCLNSEGYIDGQTTKDDFLYFFSGVGNYPSKKIKWKGSKVLLAFLMNALHKGSPTDWKTTEAVFENVKGDNLKKSLSGANAVGKNDKIIKQLIKRVTLE